LSLVNELYAEAAEFLRPITELAARETDSRAVTSSGTDTGRSVDDGQSGGEQLAPH